jgi:hypothetical protein
MLALIPAEVWLGLGGALAALVAWLGGKWSGKKEGRSEAVTDALKQELDTHDRINKADVGIGASDADRIKRLQRMGQQWERD